MSSGDNSSRTWFNVAREVLLKALGANWAVLELFRPPMLSNVEVLYQSLAQLGSFTYVLSAPFACILKN